MLDIGNTVCGGCVIRTHRGGNVCDRGIKQMVVTQSKAIEALLSKTEKEKQTNFQRITASPEALAEFIENRCNCISCPTECPATEMCNDYKSCYRAMVEWLKQESDSE